MKSKFLPFYGYRLSIALLCLCSSPNLLLANTLEKDLATIDQNKITLSGTVSDESGPLPGVIVQVKSRNNATLSDHDGNYSIQVNQGDTVEFSYMGYITKNVTINNQENLNITLQQDSQQLDEIVVNAGYYTVKDREKTGSIARVTAKDIEHQPVLNPLQAIQGRMPGVDITQMSGVPGSSMNIEIRGQNSFNRMGNAPLYVIDGIVIPSSNLPPSNLSFGILPLQEVNILSMLNPSDIENVEILKDADATAIYGSRGANGVILITTKKNKSDQLQFNFSTYTSFSKVASKMTLLNTEQFIEMRKKAFQNDGILHYPQDALDLNGTWNIDKYTDWQKELIGGTAINKNIQLGIKGGSQNTYFSVNYTNNNQNTVFPTDKGYKRNTFLINLNHNSKDEKFYINTSTNYSIQSNNLIATDLTKTALTLAPNAPDLYNEDGSLNWEFPNNKNPIAVINETYKNDLKNFLLNLETSYNLTKHLQFKLNTNYSRSTVEEQRLTPHTIFNPTLNYTSANSKSLLNFLNTETYSLEPQINYKLNLTQKLKINFLLGTTYQESTNTLTSLNGSDFQTNDFIENIAAAKLQSITANLKTNYRYIALFTRINLNYGDKYFLNLTARRDGSSRFGNDRKFGNFGAIGGAWIFSKENIFRNNSWLSNGKIRGSLGTSGNDNIGDYQYLDTYSLNPNNYNSITGLYPSRLYNPNFSWERTKKLELALELSLFNNNLQLEVAWYKNLSSNQLVGIPLPGTTGFPTIQDNLPATIQNKGWEIALTSTILRTDLFKWNTSFNLSFPKNTLVAFPNLESSTYANTYIVGKSTNILKRYSFQGIDQQTGLYKYTDYNLDNKISAPDDNKTIFEITKEFYGGLQNTLEYKNFQLDFLLYFVKQKNQNYNSSIPTPGTLSNISIESLNNWDNNHNSPIYGLLTSGTNSLIANGLISFRNSDAAVSDASYIRLKNISLSYTLPLKNKTNSRIRLYFQGQNLFTITNYFGLDPEFITPSFLPPLKTYAFGIQLNF